MFALALVTYAAAPDLTPDDRLLHAALLERGVRAEPVRWDTREDWTRFDGILVRSTWDYFVRMDEFARWIDRIDDAGLPVWNPVAMLRWNTDKRYLPELEREGVLTVPTVMVGHGDDRPLAGILAAAGWHAAVVKPSVSGGAHQTWRTSPADADRDEGRFRELVRAYPGGVMVQPFLDSIVAEGEWSLVFLDGTFSHAAIKRPRVGDFRVQQEHGGTYEPAMPSPALVEDAARVVAAGARCAGIAPGDLVYARVDGVVHGSGASVRLMLMELECVEPSLFFRQDPAAAGRMADAMVARLEASRAQRGA